MSLLKCINRKNCCLLLWKFKENKLSNKFLFIVALTPMEFLNPLRIRQQEVFLDSLKAVKYDNFQAILLGDKEDKVGKLTFVKSPNGSKGDRLKFALEYLKRNEIEYDYVARFDDDDVLNPNIFEIVNELPEADCFYDNWHAYYDLYSGEHTHEKKDWMANAILMKKEHALFVLADGRTLVEQDHAQEWHLYFRHLKKTALPKLRPIYLRILSPGSVTANAKEEQNYQTYLAGQCKWNVRPVFKDFEFDELLQIHKDFYPEGKLQIPKRSALRLVLAKLTDFLSLSK